MKDYVIMQQSATFWEIAAETKWGSYITNIEKQAILEAHGRFEKPGFALDIGCEGGRWSKLLSDLGWNLTCIDVDKDALDICKERIPTARSILVNRADTSLPVPTESMDLLLCVEVPPVISSDWFMAESYRVLAGGGILVGVVFNLVSFRGLLYHGAEVLRKLNKGTGHYDHSYLRWKKKLHRSGFKIIQERGFCWFPFTRFSNSRLVPVCEFLENSLGLSSMINISPWIVFIAEKCK
ncbi:MAG: class I SAM-dependent methyltransferase [Syntrophobacteraceae bacterium]|jgi:SAM-dependent methyltransferase